MIYISNWNKQKLYNMLQNFLKENKLICLNTKFQKRHNQLWTFIAANKSRSQIDVLNIKRKWKNSAINCRAFSSFVSVQSDHRVVWAKLRLSLRANDCKSKKKPPYDWSSLKRDTNIHETFCLHSETDLHS